MAKPIQHAIRPARIETSAREELERLLETCHRHGLLRFANDVVASNTDLARVLVGALQTEQVMNAIKNISVFIMALSRIPNEQLYRVVFAMKDALRGLAVSSQEPQESQQAPGVTGAYRMLNDEQLWHALGPLVSALKIFASGLDRNPENPISDIAGKPGHPG